MHHPRFFEELKIEDLNKDKALLRQIHREGYFEIFKDLIQTAHFNNNHNTNVLHLLMEAKYIP